VFGGVSTIAQIIAYSVGIRPSMNYAPARRVRIARIQILTVINRTVGYGVLAWGCVRLVRQPEKALIFGITVGLVVGVATFVSSAFGPMIEWGADHIPPRRMGVFGVVLMFLGFSLQSVQYWVGLLDVPVR